MASATVTRTYEVAGMSCEHCVRAVREEVGEVDGVTGVAVDLSSGTVMVQGTAFTDSAIEQAVAEAGYEVR
jgi:copper chaperone